MRSPHDVKNWNSRDNSLDHVTGLVSTGQDRCGKNSGGRTHHAPPALVAPPEGGVGTSRSQSREQGPFESATYAHRFGHSQFRR
jgi:hypothetical protein